MKVSELVIGQGNVNVEGKITEIGEVRSFSKFGRELKVANAIFTDESGSIKLTLWNNDVNFKEGDNIKILNGYVGEFQGEKQLTSGKFGKIEKIDDGVKDKIIEDEVKDKDSDDKSDDLDEVYKDEENRQSDKNEPEEEFF